MRAKSLAGQTSNLESLPLFATDDAIGAALLGPKRVAEFKQIVPLLEARGLPKVDLKLPRLRGHPNIGVFGVHNGRKHAPYAPEFRRQMIELVRAGRTPEELAKEFEPSAQAIRNWVAQADRDEGRREDGLTTVEREELNRLRRENRQLKLEREILSKAAAWFARRRM